MAQLPLADRVAIISEHLKANCQNMDISDFDALATRIAHSRNYVFSPDTGSFLPSLCSQEALENRLSNHPDCKALFVQPEPEKPINTAQSKDTVYGSIYTQEEFLALDPFRRNQIHNEYTYKRQQAVEQSDRDLANQAIIELMPSDYMNKPAEEKLRLVEEATAKRAALVRRQGTVQR